MESVITLCSNCIILEIYDVHISQCHTIELYDLVKEGVASVSIFISVFYIARFFVQALISSI